MSYIGSMFSFDFTNFNVISILRCFNREFYLMLAISLIGSCPVVPRLKSLTGRSQTLGLMTDVLLLLLFFYSVCYMMGADFNPFIYFRF